MTTLHAHLVGDKAVLPRVEFERLVELAKRSEEITVQIEEDDLPTAGIIQLAEPRWRFCLASRRTGRVLRR
jgi:hypothetical protein